MRIRLLARRFQSSQAGAGWRTEMPSVSDIQWESTHGDGAVVSRPGLPKKTKGASIDEQDRYLKGKRLLNEDPPQRRNKNKETEDLRKEFRKNNPSKSLLTQYTDDLITEKIASSKAPPQGSSPVVNQSDIARSADLTKNGVIEIMKAVEGVDLSRTTDIINVKKPPALIVPNTTGMFRDEQRRIIAASTESYVDSQSWFTEKQKTIVLITVRNTHGAAYARAVPDANFIVLTETNSSFFRTVDNGCDSDDGFAPENLKFARCGIDFYFQKIIPDASIDEIHFIYPAPFAPYAHSHKRKPTTELFELMHQKLKVGGRIRLLTDNSNFFDWVSFEAAYSQCQYERLDLSKNGSQPSKIMLEAQNETGIEIQTNWDNKSPDEAFVSEWVKTEPTPEMIYDLNEKFSYRRMNHAALGGPLRRESWRNS
eukprot:TRINITY_DN17164_c0_g1_i1.p1 TRINITY_DN17164_c0_g1~~TRINITY_DN17164_c0_g1_i1.p1  ORF type:complete len:439 (+),score=62.25 TRINITY_DN17164_c0_g1_i1:44-1318(+)